MDITYKFDQLNDTYFHDQWPHWSPNPLTVKSENSSFWRIWYTGHLKIRYMKDNNYLGTQKYDHWLWHWPKHKIAILFHFYNLKMQIIMVLLLFICRKQFSLFLHCFSVLNKSKRWQFCVLVNAWTHGHIFNVTKSFRIFLDPIFGHPVYRFPQNLNFLILLSVDLDSHGVTDYENMCHYAWRICIFWPLH